MKAFISILVFSFSLGTSVAHSQVKTDDFKLVADTIIRKPINPLAPARAAFYSAVLPGLGQAYNKKYWKIPIVYGAIGTGVYFYTTNDREYQRFRDAYKERLDRMSAEFRS